MSRIRSIKPEFWVSEQIANCSPYARLLFIGMWNFCDDAGIHPSSFLKIKSEVFPADNISLTEIKNWINELIKNGLIFEYCVENKNYWKVTGWSHQKISKPAYKYPLPSKNAVDSANSATFVRNPILSAEIIQFPPPDVDVDVDVEKEDLINKYNTNQDIITVGTDQKDFTLSAESCGNTRLLTEDNEKPIITFPLNDKSEYPIYKNKIAEWTELNPGIDVFNEILKCKSWYMDRPKKRKSKSRILSFIGDWLRRAQDYKSKDDGGKLYATRERRIESLAEKVERQQREDNERESFKSRQYL